MEPNFHPASFRDPAGRVVLDGSKVLRRLRPDWGNFFQALHDDGRLKALVDGTPLIPTEMYEFDKDAAPFGRLGLQHAPLFAQSYPWEWSFQMRRSAAVATMDLLIGCLENNLQLKDGTSLNVAWHQGRMVWFDTLSIEELKEKDLWRGYGQFCRTQLFPLLIEAYTSVDVRTWLFLQPDGITAADTSRLLGKRRMFKPGVLKHVMLQSAIEGRLTGAASKDQQVGKDSVANRGLPKVALLANARSIRKLVSKLPNPHRASVWKDYEGETSYDGPDEKQKREIVARHIQTLVPRTVTDLGCNAGSYSMIAAQSADHVVSIDFDPNAIDRVVSRDMPEEIRKKIHPFVGDLSAPSPGHGWRSGESEGLLQRIKSDFVLALALVHHLAIGKNVPLQQFVDLMADVAPAGVLEWVDKTDEMVQYMLKDREDIFDGYSEDAFRTALSKRYTIKEEIALKGGRRRLFLLAPKT